MSEPLEVHITADDAKFISAMGAAGAVAGSMLRDLYRIAQAIEDAKAAMWLDAYARRMPGYLVDITMSRARWRGAGSAMAVHHALWFEWEQTLRRWDNGWDAARAEAQR